ncbi:MAG TPA: hypothetical protein PLX89_00495 [Verrucomicrobiota bacterium]|nr:hypothetical protein [Verrucomicrobiota bacterium]
MLQATHYYVSTTQTPGSGTSLSPLTLTQALNKIQSGAEQDVDLRFLPGTYTITDPNGIRSPYSSNPRRIALIGVPTGTSMTGECILKWADNVVGTEPTTDDRVYEHYFASTTLDLDRFVLENLTLDGNFLSQTSVVGPHYREGYKSGAVKVSAKTGRIRNCVIRNFGAQGIVPWGSTVNA